MSDAVTNFNEYRSQDERQAPRWSVHDFKTHLQFGQPGV